MQGGGTVRFFHRTHECYIVAEGSFAGRFASEEVIRDLMESHIQELEPESTPQGTGTVLGSNVSYLDTPYEEQSLHTLGGCDQKVHVEVHDEDRETFKHPPLSSIRGASMNRAGTYFSVESSLGVADRATLLQKLSSFNLELESDEDHKVVTDDGK